MLRQLCYDDEEESHSADAANKDTASMPSGGPIHHPGRSRIPSTPAFLLAPQVDRHYHVPAALSGADTT
jgi:hypothetical protein